MPIVSIAPMMKYTDRLFRRMIRFLSKKTWLYTEMVVSSSLIWGKPSRWLTFDTEEKPLFLQLASHNAEELRKAIIVAEDYDFTGYNLNIGCPSPRVQARQFGACQMENPQRVAEMVAAVRSVSNKTISVKHRIGIGPQASYEDLSRFVSTVSSSGADHFIVHAREALLSGLSPKENRNIPPLRYNDVRRLKKDFPLLTIEINGGISTLESLFEHLESVDGVMLGRHAYKHPLFFANIDSLVFGAHSPFISYENLIERIVDYAKQWEAEGGRMFSVLRHSASLFTAHPHARQWRAFVHHKKVDDMILFARSADEYSTSTKNGKWMR